MAECLRTFPTLRFDAPGLLKREEIETGKASSRSLVVPMDHQGGGKQGGGYTDAPFDLMYALRGKRYEVDLH